MTFYKEHCFSGCPFWASELNCRGPARPSGIGLYQEQNLKGSLIGVLRRQQKD